MAWIPINKKTGQRYPAISDEAKKEMENYEVLIINGIHKYRFEKTTEKPKEEIKPPVETLTKKKTDKD